MSTHLRHMLIVTGLTVMVPQMTQSADAPHGELIARRWCAACHIIAAGQARGGDTVPTFGSIARKPDFNAQMLALYLLDPHPKMPDMALSRQEAEDIAAYIGQLKN